MEQVTTCYNVPTDKQVIILSSIVIRISDVLLVTYVDMYLVFHHKGRVCLQIKWPIRSKHILVSVA